MGYEVEISIDLKKNKNGLKTVDSLIEIADDNNCKRHFQFSENDGEVRRLKRMIHVMVFCFDNIEFENMTKFLEETLKRYKKKITIESIYNMETNQLIHASAYYMSIMEKDVVTDYKHRRQTRSYSDTDYYILRDILKKITD